MNISKSTKTFTNNAQKHAELKKKEKSVDASRDLCEYLCVCVCDAHTHAGSWLLNAKASDCSHYDAEGGEDV